MTNEPTPKELADAYAKQRGLEEKQPHEIANKDQQSAWAKDEVAKRLRSDPKQL